MVTYFRIITVVIEEKNELIQQETDTRTTAQEVTQLMQGCASLCKKRATKMGTTAPCAFYVPYSNLITSLHFT